MKLQKLVTTSVCVTCLSIGGVVGAQQAQPQRNQVGQVQSQVQGQPRTGQAGQQTRWMTNDQVLASCIAISNQAEIAIAKAAQDKVNNKDVKDYVNMLVKDHQAFLQKLQKFAPEAAREGYLNEVAGSADRDRQTTSNQQRVQPAGGESKNANGQIQQTAGARAAGGEANQPLDFVQLHREVAEQCIQSAKAGMNKKSAAEFDECFIGFQIAAHAMMKDKLVVFQRHASGEFNQTIAEGLQTTERHLKRAEELMKSLNDSEDRKSASKD